MSRHFRHSLQTMTTSTGRGFKFLIKNIEENLIIKLSVANFPNPLFNKKPVGNPYWGNDKNNLWAGDGRHIIELKLSSGLMKYQSNKFLISAIKGQQPVVLFGDPESQSYIQIK